MESAVNLRWQQAQRAEAEYWESASQDAREFLRVLHEMERTHQEYVKRFCGKARRLTVVGGKVSRNR